MQHVRREGDHHIVEGQIFFASAEAFVEAFDPIDHDAPVTIDLSRGKLWNITVMAAVEKVRDRFLPHNLLVTIRGLERPV